MGQYGIVKIENYYIIMLEEKQTPNNNLPITPQAAKVSKLNIGLSYWYINNKLRLRQALVIFLILLSVGFYLFTLYRGATIIFIDDPILSRNLGELTDNSIDYTYFHRANQPAEIQILSFDSTAGTDGRFDFVAKLANPNENFTASKVDLLLVVGSKPIAEKSTFILPGEEKLVVFFGEEIEQFGSPVLHISKVQWARQRSYAEYAEPRLNFEITGLDFTSANNQLPVSTLNFKIKNNTAFSYWQVGVYASLISGGSITAGNFISLDQFVSGEIRDVEMRWHEPLFGVTDFEIFTEVNILDESVFMGVR